MWFIWMVLGSFLTIVGLYVIWRITGEECFFKTPSGKFDFDWTFHLLLGFFSHRASRVWYETTSHSYNFGGRWSALLAVLGIRYQFVIWYEHSDDEGRHDLIYKTHWGRGTEKKILKDIKNTNKEQKKKGTGHDCYLQTFAPGFNIVHDFLSPLKD